MRYFTPVLVFVLMSMCGGFAVAVEPGDDLLLNGSIENGDGNLPSVWFIARVPADGLKMERTDETCHSKKYSLLIANSHQYEKKVSNNWAQKITDVPVGQAVRIEAWMRTENAEAVNVCVQCWDAETKNMLGFASTPVMRGEQKWTRVRSNPVVVPPNTESIIVRAALTGLGKAWFDDLSLKVVKHGVIGGNDDEAAADNNDDRSSATEEIVPAGDEEEKSAAESGADVAKLAGGRIAHTLPVTQDCMVLAYMPDWNYGNVDNIGVANNQGGVRTLLRWNSKNLESMKGSLEDKKVYLALYSRQTMSKPNPGMIEIYEIRSKWPERTSWNTQPQYADNPIAQSNFQPGNGWKLFDITALIHSQSESKQGNNGVMLRFKKEDFAPNSWSGYQFPSREGLGEWKDRRPRLLIVEPTKKAGDDNATGTGS
jgi:hypothetical protein